MTHNGISGGRDLVDRLKIEEETGAVSGHNKSRRGILTSST